MTSVARGVVLPVLDWVRARGYACAGVFDGFPVEEAELRTRVRSIEWEWYARFYERLAAEVGGPEPLSAILADIDTPSVDWILRAAGGPRPMYKLWTHLAPLLWGILRLEVDEVPGGALQISMAIPADASPAGAFFGSIGGMISAMTGRLGLPPARVECLRLDTHGAVWLVHLAPSTGTDTAAPAVSWAFFEEVLGLNTDLRHMRDTLQLLQRVPPADAPSVRPTLAGPDGQAQLASVVAAWGLTPAQTGVLRGVVRGLTNKEIATELGNAEATVEVHVTRILRKARATGRTSLVSRFWTWTRDQAS